MAVSLQTSGDLQDDIGKSFREQLSIEDTHKFLRLLTDANLIEKPLELRTEEFRQVKVRLDGVNRLV